MLTLNSEEMVWVKEFCIELEKRFPNLVRDVFVFGSKARGDIHPDSDLDVLILIESGDWKTKKQIRESGYESSIGKDVVPSILVYTQNEWNQRKSEESIFQELVEREGVSIR